MVCAFGAEIARAQVRGDTRAAEQVFKNPTSMKGIPADEFMATMGFFAASLGISCGDCHTAESGGDGSKYADNGNPRKARSRGMIAMVKPRRPDQVRDGLVREGSRAEEHGGT
jgi:hypothetical protein